MGLDMYLEIKREEYVSAYSQHCDKELGKVNSLDLAYPKELIEKVPNLPPLERITRVTRYEVGYWRKANAIHNWFVENCGGGVDKCQEMHLSVEKLEDLLDSCNKVLANHKLASTYLPTKKGFFFGPTGYDEYYFKDLEDTVNIITPVIEFMKEIANCQDIDDWYYVVYQASW